MAIRNKTCYIIRCVRGYEWNEQTNYYGPFLSDRSRAFEAMVVALEQEGRESSTVLYQEIYAEPVFLGIDEAADCSVSPEVQAPLPGFSASTISRALGE